MAGNKKKNGNRRNKRKNKMVVLLGRSPIPTSVLVKLRYCDSIAIDPASGGITGSHLFRVNSLFDPDETSAGHQPLAYDEYAALYSRYCVLGAKITVKCINTSSTIPLIFGIVLRNVTPGLAVSPNMLREQGDSTWGYAGNIGAKQNRSISKTFSAKKFFGYPKPLNETDLRASTTANPAVTGYFQVWGAAADNVSNPGAMTYQVTIDYIAVFTKPHALPQS